MTASWSHCPLTDRIFIFRQKKKSLSVSWLLLVYIDSVLVINFIILYIHCDLGGIASQMRSCRSPEDFPKTLVFCKTKSQCVKLLNIFMAMSTHKGLISMYHATHFCTGSSQLGIQTFAAWCVPLHLEW